MNAAQTGVMMRVDMASFIGLLSLLPAQNPTDDVRSVSHRPDVAIVVRGAGLHGDLAVQGRGQASMHDMRFEVFDRMSLICAGLLGRKTWTGFIVACSQDVALAVVHFEYGAVRIPDAVVGEDAVGAGQVEERTSPPPRTSDRP